jgi:TonB family protein
MAPDLLPSRNDFRPRWVDDARAAPMFQIESGRPNPCCQCANTVVHGFRLTVFALRATRRTTSAAISSEVTGQGRPQAVGTLPMTRSRSRTTEMRQMLLARLTLAIVSTAFAIDGTASEPGRPVDCSDLLLETGLTCLDATRFPCTEETGERRTACFFEDDYKYVRAAVKWQHSVQRSRCGKTSVLLHVHSVVLVDGNAGREFTAIQDRCGSHGTVDRVRPLHRIQFEKSGQIALPLISTCDDISGSARCGYAAEYWIATLEGPNSKQSGVPCEKGETFIPLYGCVAPPTLLDLVPPRYPSIAHAAQIPNTVVLEAIVDATGRVTTAGVLDSAVPGIGFEAAAIEAVRQWRYSPARLDGLPVQVYWTLQVDFSLDEGVKRGNPAIRPPSSIVR